METITMEDAIAKGYTHFVEEEGEHVQSFEKVNEKDRKYLVGRKFYIVDMTEEKYFVLKPETIKYLISNHVAEQDEMFDEDGKLCGICENYDYSQLANELNEKFKAHKYFEPMDILVTF